jgi:hypothetical protein
MANHKGFQVAMLLTSAVIILAGTSCRREHLTPDRIVGKVVIDGVCGNYAVQVISGKIDSSRLLASWLDGDTTYTNVFTVANRCNFGGYGLKQGQEFSFQLSDSAIVQSCAICDIYVAVPNVANTVIDVQPMP